MIDFYLRSNNDTSSSVFFVAFLSLHFHIHTIISKHITTTHSRININIVADTGALVSETDLVLMEISEGSAVIILITVGEDVDGWTSS